MISRFDDIGRMVECKIERGKYPVPLGVLHELACLCADVPMFIDVWIRLYVADRSLRRLGWR